MLANKECDDTDGEKLAKGDAAQAKANRAEGNDQSVIQGDEEMDDNITAAKVEEEPIDLQQIALQESIAVEAISRAIAVEAISRAKVVET